MESAMRTIQQIDKDITANIRALRGRARPKDAADWQVLRDANPTLAERDNALYRERGEAQRERDAKAYKAFLSIKHRQPRLKKCPTCGQRAAIAI
jgi:hypothetical protein